MDMPTVLLEREEKTALRNRNPCMDSTYWWSWGTPSPLPEIQATNQQLGVPAKGNECI